MKIIIGGVVSRYPYVPGSVWHRMHYAVGFQRLGHEVYYLEEVDPTRCVDAQSQPCQYEHSVNRALFQMTMSRFGLMDRACQLYNHGEATCGLAMDSLVALSKEADMLINMSGHVTTDVILGNVKRRVYVDQDPIYTQLWHAEYGKDLNFKRHDVFCSVGLNIGTPDSPIPDCGLEWHHLLPPVVLDYWPFRFDPSCQRVTTIASWSGYHDLCYRGQWYRSKYEEFKRFAGLPREVSQAFEVCLKSHREKDEDIRLLKDNGWALSDASDIADLDHYQQYIARSRGEIGIAKHAYVKGHSGWFSDRASHYLASGKPVLAQSTGFERHVPTGWGLLTFGDMEAAMAGIESINRDYEGHCRAARAFAEEWLDYRKVLPKMLAVCNATEPAARTVGQTAQKREG